MSPIHQFIFRSTLNYRWSFSRFVVAGLSLFMLSAEVNANRGESPESGGQSILINISPDTTSTGVKVGIQSLGGSEKDEALFEYWTKKVRADEGLVVETNPDTKTFSVRTQNSEEQAGDLQPLKNRVLDVLIGDDRATEGTTGGAKENLGGALWLDLSTGNKSYPPVLFKAEVIDDEERRIKLTIDGLFYKNSFIKFYIYQLTQAKIGPFEKKWMSMPGEESSSVHYTFPSSLDSHPSVEMALLEQVQTLIQDSHNQDTDPTLNFIPSQLLTCGSALIARSTEIR